MDDELVRFVTWLDVNRGVQKLGGELERDCHFARLG